MNSRFNDKVGIFICGSDNRRDVLDRVVPSILKFWPDAPYRKYIGLNTAENVWPGIQSLVAEKSDWRRETFRQISEIPETHLIVILDDFLIQRRVDQARLAEVVDIAVQNDLKYIRLLPLGVSLSQRLLRHPHRSQFAELADVHVGRPFFSALQIAVWNKAHFSRLLMQEGSIWDFEHQKEPGVMHYAIASDPPIVYQHLVERGKWLPHAKSLLDKAGLPSNLGSRSVCAPSIRLKLLSDKVRHFLFGYSTH